MRLIQADPSERIRLVPTEKECLLMPLPDSIGQFKCSNQSVGLKTAFGAHHDLPTIDGDVPRRCESVLLSHRAKGVTEPPHQSPRVLEVDPGTTDQSIGDAVLGAGCITAVHKS